MILICSCRLKSFVEEGERETMKEQISVLQNKVGIFLSYPLTIIAQDSLPIV